MEKTPKRRRLAGRRRETVARRRVPPPRPAPPPVWHRAVRAHRAAAPPCWFRAARMRPWRTAGNPEQGCGAALAVGAFDPGYLQRRWAPYVRAHEPGQGQLPSGSIRPRGYDSVAPRSPAGANLITQAPCRHHAGDSFFLAIQLAIQAFLTIQAVLPRPAGRLGVSLVDRARSIEPPCNPFEALGGSVKSRRDGRLGDPGMISDTR